MRMIERRKEHSPTDPNNDHRKSRPAPPRASGRRCRGLAHRSKSNGSHEDSKPEPLLDAQAALPYSHDAYCRAHFHVKKEHQ